MNYDRIFEKLEQLDQKVGNIETTIAKQEVQLENHIYRTELAEENIALLRDQIKPLETSNIQLHGIIKFFSAIGFLITMICTIVKIIHLVS